MTNSIITDKQIQKTLKTLNSCGVFVTAGSQNPNVTAVSFGAIGTFWSRPVFVLAMRNTRHTYDLIAKSNEFAVSVPYKDLTNELFLCGSISGRTHDKFSEAHLHSQPAKSINTYVIGDCGLFLECKVVFKAGMEGYQLAPDLLHDVYEHKNFHTMFFGEIVNCYEEI